MTARIGLEHGNPPASASRTLASLVRVTTVQLVALKIGRERSVALVRVGQGSLLTLLLGFPCS